MAKVIKYPTSLVKNMETERKHLIFKIWDERKQTLTDYGYRSVEWIKKFYAYHQIVLFYSKLHTYTVIVCKK